MNIWKVEKTLVLIFFVSLVNFIDHAQGLKCYQCKSDSDNNCIEDVTKVNVTECAPEEDSCFTKFEFETIIRGCVKGGSPFCSEPFCSECKSNGCNTNIICAKCDSASSENCITASKYLAVICPSGRDKCITRVRDDKTLERNCVSSATTCDFGKAKTCKVCDKSYCNKDLFPKDRKSCYQCKGDNCNNVKDSQLDLCPLYEEEEKCYMFGTSEKGMNRGCISDVGNKCSSSESESNGKCVTCEEKGCNDKKYKREASRKCFQGESSSEEAKLCKNPLEYWKTTEECFIQKSADGKIISRGCVNDRAIGGKPCNAENSCEICETDGCNFVDDNGGGATGGEGGSGAGGSGLQCYQCDSDKDPNCMKDLSKMIPVGCTEGETSCITKFDGEKMTRACHKSGSICVQPFCSECKEDGCNTNIICAKCDSTTNANCLTASQFPLELCSNGKDKCITQVKDDKTIERKCVSSTIKCEESKAKTCEVCDKSYCNKDLFPKDRKSCYQCEGDNCNEVKDSQLDLCLLYEEEEKCYMFGTSEKDMNRGCISDVGNKCSSSETESNGKCVTCEEKGCNDQKYKREPSRKCFQGESSSEEAKLCKNPLEYWKTTEECFIQKSADGKIISRGCVNDRAIGEKLCNEENSCKTCGSDGCNTDVEGGGGSGGGSGGTGSDEFECIRCRSSNPGEEWCKDEIKNRTGEICRKKVNSGEEGCFTDRWNDGTIVRGCLVDYDEKSRNDCTNDAYKFCQSCKEAKCNIEKAPNGVSGLRATIGLLIVTIVSLRCMF